MSHSLAISASKDAQNAAGKLPVSDVALGIEDLEFSIGRFALTTPATVNAGVSNTIQSKTDAFSITVLAKSVKADSETFDDEDENRVEFSPGEVGHAQRFVTHWGHATRFDTDRGFWMTWQKNHWGTDYKRSSVLYRMTKVADNILKVEVPALWACVQEPGDWYSLMAKKVKEEGNRLHNHRTMLSALAIAETRPKIRTATSQYDADPMKFNCLSGVIDLPTGFVHPHRPEDMHSRIAPVALAPEGSECPRWMKFLNEIMCGDTELVSYVQRVIGYILTGSVKEQCFFILYGNGSNGKSTFINVICELMGGYGSNVDIRTFMDIDRGNAPRNDLAALAGMRFVVSPEWKLGQALDEAILKTFSGGDLVSARFLNKEMFQFRPMCKIVLASNHKPIVKGTDHGIWRRMRLVPFLANFDGLQNIKDLDKVLLAEEGPAILRWAMQGAQLWASQGLHTPAIISEATTEYRNTQDWLLTFLEDRCDVQANASVASQLIYNDYKNWCEAAGIRAPVKQQAFNERLMGHKFQKKATKFANIWVGLKLRTGTPVVHAGDDGVAMSMQPDQDSSAHSNEIGDLNFGL